MCENRYNMSDINRKILEKLEKFSRSTTELEMCKELLNKEIRWFDIADPPIKREFTHLLDQFFPFEETDNG